MKRITNLLLWVLPVLWLTACGYHQAATQKSDTAYLLFIGPPQGEQVEIDGSTRLTLGSDTRSYNLNGKTATKIAIPAGTHTVKLSRQGQLLIHRKIFVTEGNQYEIQIP